MSGNSIADTLYDPTVDATLEKVARLSGQYERAVIAVVGHTDSSMKGRGVRFEDVRAAVARPRRMRSRTRWWTSTSSTPTSSWSRARAGTSRPIPDDPLQPRAQPAGGDLGLPARGSVEAVDDGRAPTHRRRRRRRSRRRERRSRACGRTGSRHWLRIRETVPAWLRWSLGVVPIARASSVSGGSSPRAAEAEQRIISPTILPSPLRGRALLPVACGSTAP